MKLYLAVLLVCIAELNGAKLTNKRTQKPSPHSAIIAIQIIDPHENKTYGKNSKRTVDSSVGYGYQDIFGGQQLPQRYEVYKYSQHDILPYAQPQLTAGTKSETYNVQDSVSNPTHNSAVSNYLQPGTVLFSTINQHGQLGGLSSQFPLPLENHHFPIPVIILRVHSNQLANPVYPSLPQNHAFASTINSIDINSLLSNHLTSASKQPAQYQQSYQQTQTYVQPQSAPAQYQTAEYQQEQYYPQYQYEETQQNNEGYKQQELPEPRSPGVVSNYQYTSSPVYQQAATAVNDFNSPELLTHENYPSEKHTQVVFKRSKKVAGKPTNSKKHTYTPVVVQPTEPPAPTQESQHQDGETSDSGTKYDVPAMYYTVQYSDDQQYVYKNDPQYANGQVRDEYRDVPEAQDYVYVPAQPEKRN